MHHLCGAGIAGAGGYPIDPVAGLPAAEKTSSSHRDAATPRDRLWRAFRLNAWYTRGRLGLYRPQLLKKERP